MSIAIISLGGKQFIVTPGKIIRVPHLAKEAGEILELADLLTGKYVTARVLKQVKSKKVRVTKFRNKTRYKRTLGARQALTEVSIEEPAKK